VDRVICSGQLVVVVVLAMLVEVVQVAILEGKSFESRHF